MSVTESPLILSCGCLLLGVLLSCIPCALSVQRARHAVRPLRGTRGAGPPAVQESDTSRNPPTSFGSTSEYLPGTPHPQPVGWLLSRGFFPLSATQSKRATTPGLASPGSRCVLALPGAPRRFAPSWTSSVVSTERAHGVFPYRASPVGDRRVLSADIPSCDWRPFLPVRLQRPCIPRRPGLPFRLRFRGLIPPPLGSDRLRLSRVDDRPGSPGVPVPPWGVPLPGLDPPRPRTIIPSVSLAVPESPATCLGPWPPFMHFGRVPCSGH